MLEKLITNLKNSLPEPIRKKLGGDSEVEDEEEESGADELKRYESDDDEPSADEAAEKKKKQINMAIRVVLILGIAYLAIDQFVLTKSPSEPSIDEMLAKMPVKKKKSKKALAAEAEAKAAEEAKAKAAAGAADPAGAADATAATDTAATSSTTADSTAGMEVPPIENVNILDKNETASGSNSSPEAQMQIESPSTEIVSSKTVDTSVDNKIDQLVENVEQSTPADTSSSLSLSSSEPEEINIPSQPRQSVGQSTMSEPKPKKDTSMASKIVEVATETPAPAYDQVGRGLVYNCKDKYWACVDKPAYLLCNRNMKWNKSKGNNMECVVSDIYNTDEDCGKVQKYNVSMSVATTFCQ